MYIQVLNFAMKDSNVDDVSDNDHNIGLEEYSSSFSLIPSPYRSDDDDTSSNAHEVSYLNIITSIIALGCSFILIYILRIYRC